MNLLLFYDTETAGLPIFKEPSDHPDQPHFVQIAAKLVDADTRKTVASIDLTVKPLWGDIPEEMTAIHGISTVYAHAIGVKEVVALGCFLDLAMGHTRVAYNEQFDARIIRIAQSRYGFSEDDLEVWKTGNAECCMKMAQKHIGGKFPKLIAAHQHFLGKVFDGQHTAMGDVDACIAVYFAIKDLENGTNHINSEVSA